MRMFGKIAFLTAVLAFATLGMAQTLTFQGAYSGVTAYAANDVVTYHQGIYKALQSTTGNTPPEITVGNSTAYWSLIHAQIIYGVDGTTQTARPTIVPVQFAQGEIAHYPKILVNGSALTAGNWQENVDVTTISGVDYNFGPGNRWDDGSVRFAITAFIANVASTGTIITWTDDTTGAHSGGLSQSAMASFDDGSGAGNWDFKFQFSVPAALTSSGTLQTVTKSAKTMLANDGDPATNTTDAGHTRYWLYGPVVTSVWVRDLTSTFADTFGWKWAGGLESLTVVQNGGSGCTSTSNGTITLNGSGGSGATAHYVASGGVVTSAVVDTAGSNYYMGTNGGLVATAAATGCTKEVHLVVNIAAKMIDNAGSPYTGTSNNASILPMYVLYFFPSKNTIKGRYIWEIGTLGVRYQDQIGNITLMSGSADTVQWKQLGARKLTDAAIATVGGVTQITSATASFTQADENVSMWTPTESYEVIGMARYVNGTTVKFPYSTFTGCTDPSKCADTSGTESGLQLWINRHTAMTRHSKVFWSGTALGHVRTDANFAWLAANKLLPNYDMTRQANPATAGDGNNGMTSWTQWTTTATSDLGEANGWGGFNSWDLGYANNSEGAPLQREDLIYWTNTGSCGTAGSDCAKGYAMIFGDYSTNDSLTCNLYMNGTNTACNALGGLGTAYNLGNVPFHYRESQSTSEGQSSANKFYCAVFENKNIAGNATTANCTTASDGTSGGDGNVADPTLDNAMLGRVFSKDAHSNNRQAWPYGAGPGNTTRGGWDTDFPVCAHWLDYSYTPYLLTGDPYFLDEIYQSASWCISATAVQNGYGQANGFFVAEATTERSGAWSLQQVGRAAYLAPKGSAEASYFKAKLLSTSAIEEGMGGVTGTNLTPTNTTCTSYSATTANRWCWGRNTEAAGLAQGGIYEAYWGLGYTGCGIGGDANNYDNTANTVYLVPTYHVGWWALAMRDAYHHGFTDVLGTYKGFASRYLGLINDSTSNPYLSSNYLGPFRNGTGSGGCSSNTTDPYTTNWAQWITNTNTKYQAASTFDTYNASTQPHGIEQFRCADHSYSLTARATSSQMQEFGLSISDANCQGGSCTAANTWTFLSNEVPYWSDTLHHCTATGSGWNCTGAAVSTDCSGQGDIQIKYSLAALPASSPSSSNGSIQTSNTVRTAGTVMQ